MKTIKTWLATIAVLLFSITANAHEFEVDGIYYSKTSNTEVSVTYRGSYYDSYNNEYSGNVVIPSTVRYSGKEYSVTSIGYHAFYSCDNLTSITIPNSVTSIGDEAFRDCSSLWKVLNFSNLNITKGSSGYGYVGFYAYVVANNAELIDNYVFAPNGNTYALYGYMGTDTNLQLPEKYKGENYVIGDYAFSYCSGLTSVTIPNSVTSIGEYAFYGCSGLTSVTIGNSVTSIGDYAFYGCSGLTSVTIPNSVTSIEQSAFYGCSGLTSVTIGNSVTSIGYDAFRDCSELLDVYCYAENVPSTLSTAFSSSPIADATLHVPNASVDSYKATAPWSGFGKIVGLSGEETQMEKCATPVVTYAEGKLSFSCETEGAEFVTKILSDDISTFYDAEIELSATYNIEVYASKANFENSDTVSVALVWVENGNVDEETGVISVPAAPVLVQGNGGVLNISGVAKDTEIVVYTVSGTEVARATATEGTTTINTGLQSGTIVIVKFGNKSVKIKI